MLGNPFVYVALGPYSASGVSVFGVPTMNKTSLICTTTYFLCVQGGLLRSLLLLCVIC